MKGSRQNVLKQSCNLSNSYLEIMVKDTVCPQIMSFPPTSFHCNVDEKNQFLAGTTVCVESECS